MSSRDIGPALPPHMRKSHGETHEDAKSRSKRFGDVEKNGNRKDESRRHRNNHDAKGTHQDRELKRRTKRVSGSSSPNRSRGTDRKREGCSGKEIDKEKEKWRRGRMSKDMDREPRNAGSSRYSKRSKTDRTYNTDTEESSDSSDDNQELTKVRNVDVSDPDSDEEEVDADADRMEHPFSNTEPAGSYMVDPSDESNYVIGPALPPHLPKGSLDGDSESETDTATVSSKQVGLNSHLGSPIVQAVQSKSSESIGPALPPHLLSKQNEETTETNSLTVLGSALPPQIKGKGQIDDQSDRAACIGPALPPNLHRSLLVDQEDTPSSIGPALPPHLQKKTSSHIGPALPPSLVKAHASHMESDHESSVIGPALPPQLKESTVPGPTLPPGMLYDGSSNTELDENSSDDEVLGPLLPEEMTKSGKNYMIQAQLERNAAAIKRKFDKKDSLGVGTSRREEWMLELPPEGSVDLGLGPRTFRARGAPEKGADRSMWTDTPADKARKEDEAKRRFDLGISSTDEIKKVAVSKELSGKDKSMEDVVKKHKRSKESLLDSHQKKLKEEKKKKEKSSVKQERRPFNRETDLKTNVFDDAQKKSIFKKAQLLDSRFSRGESKFL